MTLATGIVVNRPTESMNIYTRDQLEEVIKRFNNRAKTKKIYGGELNPYAINELGESTHVVKNIFINDDDMVCVEIELLNNKNGRNMMDKINKSTRVAARPIMCLPKYAADAVSESDKNEPVTITKLNSIIRVQVECDG